MFKFVDRVRKTKLLVIVFCFLILILGACSRSNPLNDDPAHNKYDSEKDSENKDIDKLADDYIEDSENKDEAYKEEKPQIDETEIPVSEYNDENLKQYFDMKYYTLWYIDSVDKGYFNAVNIVGIVNAYFQIDKGSIDNDNHILLEENFGAEEIDYLYEEFCSERNSFKEAISNSNVSLLINIEDSMIDPCSNFFSEALNSIELMNRMGGEEDYIIYAKEAAVPGQITNAHYYKYNEKIQQMQNSYDDLMKSFVKFEAKFSEIEMEIKRIFDSYGLDYLNKLSVSQFDYIYNKFNDNKDAKIDEIRSWETELPSFDEDPVSIKFHKSRILDNCLLLPFSDMKIMSLSDIASLSKNDIPYARNEIYARKGYPFQKAKYIDFFSSKDWYNINSNFEEDDLSAIEKKNIEFLASQE